MRSPVVIASGLRRWPMLVNACCSTLHLEESLPAKAEVTPVKKANRFNRGVQPSQALP